MGSMSDLHLLARNVKNKLDNGADSLDEAVTAVAQNSLYDAEDIRWAYNERFGHEVELVDGGRYTNIRVGDEMVASIEPDTGELCVYQPGAEEPDEVFDLDL